MKERKVVKEMQVISAITHDLEAALGQISSDDYLICCFIDAIDGLHEPPPLQCPETPSVATTTRLELRPRLGLPGNRVV